jgi:polyhydroxybutyrate depolymerase
MIQRIAICLIIAIGLTVVNAQTTINLRGKVSNKAGNPVSNAIVTLVKQGISDTTGADGMYAIAGGTGVQLPLLMPQNQFISMSNGFVIFSLPAPSPVKVEIFDTKGNLLKREVKQNAITGFYRFKIEENAHASKLLIIKASIGQDQVILRYLPVHNSMYAVRNGAGSGVGVEKNGFVKLAAVNDTLKTTAPNYKTQITAITSYDQLVNITLDTAGGGGVKPSAGCGKETTLKGQQRLKIPSGGKDREYIIRLPDDYDKNTPYRLWFSVHCLGGTASGVADAKGYEYYGIWKFANPTGQKGTTIFCSPEGLVSTVMGGSTTLGWDNKSGVDVEFFRAMIKKFESELCIDESRIFSEGFSMGGSMSYALACAMPDTFRAICMHSGGSMSGCDQKNRGPVPIFITHGTKDQVLAYPGSGVPQIKDLAARDSCTAIDIANVCKPTDASGKNPACVDYQGCKAGYPCKACIFVGQHEYMPGGGASATWVDDSTWNWFKQF